METYSMKNKKAMLVCFLLAVCIILIGCKEKQQVQSTAVIEKSLPASVQEIVNYPSGQFASAQYQISRPNILRKLENFPILRDDASKQEMYDYFTSIYSIFKMDYPDPNVLIKDYTINLSMDGYVPSEIQMKQQYNIEIILDASGSMATKMGNNSRMELAKESINNFISTLPEDVNVSLRVYGHKGTSADADKDLSCASSELVYPLQPYDATVFQASLQSFNPAGWTPLAQSMMASLKDFEKVASQNNRNIIYIVSDGIETCDGDPVKAAETLKNSGVAPVVNIIGFDLDNEGQSQLKAVAEAADGTYVNIQKQEELYQEFIRSREKLMKWQFWLDKSIEDLRLFTNQQRILINQIKKEWDDLQLKENYHVQFSLEVLQSSENVSSQQVETLNQIRNEHYSLQKEAIENYLEKLQFIIENDYNRSLQRINDIYRQNSSEIR